MTAATFYALLADALRRRGLEHWAAGKSVIEATERYITIRRFDP